MATIKEVAQLAGVSPMTASRVVNGKGNVRPDLKARVLKAVESLNYTRNYAAATLRQRSQPTWTIGLVIENVANPYLAQLHREIEDTVRAEGSFVLACSTDEDRQQVLRLVHELRARDIDGLIIAPPPGEQTYLATTPPIPTVLVDRPAVGVSLPSVATDGRKGTREAVEHLIAHGHQRIAYLTDLRSATMQARHQGFIEGLLHNGIQPHEDIVLTDIATSHDARKAVHSLLGSSDPPTAIVTGRDGTTIGATRGLHEHRAHFDVALVGFDDVATADLIEPGISVVAQDPRRVGGQAAQLLLAQLADPDQPTESRLIPTRLIERGSGEILGPFAP
ncbi:LacI family DNA-binding transcriptional regulator [Nesterenkonia sp. K-15-9-6]|uniref:LacI family DNA-binding transcriptional regulator n=1 Tax=Nesterenkonia sp. K-15-9-6 TaxID=3093918 RepID=UPI004044ED8E